MVFWNENCFILEELFIEYLNKWNYEVDFAGDTNFTFDGLFWQASYAGGHAKRKKNGGYRGINK